MSVKCSEEYKTVALVSLADFQNVTDHIEPAGRRFPIRVLNYGNVICVNAKSYSTQKMSMTHVAQALKIT
jgi:hypothetical protein